MPVQTKRENDIFRMVAGVIMVSAILFGVLELMDVVRIWTRGPHGRIDGGEHG